ncbi:MAG: hypothetical protein HYY96_12110 [Candidatus Tectomicrobia bacterium]|nr:hypothetical protein [Candidatus Tectomicrobia bacterium]
MTREALLARLRRIRDEIEAVRRETDSPAIDSAMRSMSMYCHLARSYLGDIDAICPEVEQVD